MRVWISALLVSFTLLPACGEGGPSTGGTGGSGGGTGTTPEGGGGSAPTGSTTDTGTGSATDTGTSSATETGTGSTTDTGTMIELTGCEDAGQEPVSFADDVQPIFSQSCGSATTCHLKAVPSESLSLKPGSSYAALVDVNAKQSCNGQKRVAPGGAAASYLVNKITATGVCPNKKKMPPSSSLSAAKKQTIIDWICQGAQDN